MSQNTIASTDAARDTSKGRSVFSRFRDVTTLVTIGLLVLGWVALQ